MLTRCFVILLAVSVASCSKGDGRLATFPVTGKVVDGGKKPLANATVVFHPIGGPGDAVKPRGKTDENGEFKLTTYDGNDGAPAGKYQVTVELWMTLSADQGPVSRLNPRYAKPDSSGLTAEVQARPTTLEPFEVKK